jgi:hypothetical protein
MKQFELEQLGGCHPVSLTVCCLYFLVVIKLLLSTDVEGNKHKSWNFENKASFLPLFSSVSNLFVFSCVLVLKGELLM